MDDDSAPDSVMDKLDINRAAGAWQDQDEAAVRAAVAGAFGLLRARRLLAGPAELSILLSNDAAIRDLNKKYRGQDRPTNVLSFPASPSPPVPGCETAARFLGDIALARETLAREAAEQDKLFVAHLGHLTVHGLLHLLGFDHEQGDAEAAAMEALERDVMSALGFPDPYRDVDGLPHEETAGPQGRQKQM